MIQPVSDHALEQIGTAEQRAVAGRRAAQHDVIASSGARVPAIDHEFLRAQA